ncbi:hypothetical protein CCACVL1_11068 [Corchorus capsularis]|uniref:Uncharacterized protein n=1 Tax=Corchorus capsularis TaxID=210143 RepID=A0A1R3IN38_COCAP|nr:hypothetical protein CCACVL1_11068 [Corchorus capsularis]
MENSPQNLEIDDEDLKQEGVQAGS